MQKFIIEFDPKLHDYAHAALLNLLDTDTNMILEQNNGIYTVQLTEVRYGLFIASILLEILYNGQWFNYALIPENGMIS